MSKVLQICRRFSIVNVFVLKSADFIVKNTQKAKPVQRYADFLRLFGTLLGTHLHIIGDFWSVWTFLNKSMLVLDGQVSKGFQKTNFSQKSRLRVAIRGVFD